MHEAALAAAIAATISERGLQGRQLRVLVAGGHGGTASFDSALRAHLAAALGGTGDHIEIASVPVGLMCSGCARTYEGDTSAVACPSCGGAPLPAHQESVAIEVIGEDEP